MNNDSSMVEKSFSPAELTELLTRAATHLVDRCRTLYCDPAPPSKFVFLLEPLRASSPRTLESLANAADAVRELLRADGAFRDWINLSPIAVTGDATVLELDYPDRFTTRLFVGKLAFPFEPFHLLGPALPADWREGAPTPKVTLPPFTKSAG